MYTCEFEGFPPPYVVFYFNGAPILASSTIGVNIINNTLIIPSPQVSHSGIYQCIVSNEFGDDQQAWLLEIREPSKLSNLGKHLLFTVTIHFHFPVLPQVQPYNVTNLDAFEDRELGALFTRDNGSTVSFFVDVVADPCPDVVWSFNGIRLGPSNETFTYNNAKQLVWGHLLGVVTGDLHWMWY